MGTNGVIGDRTDDEEDKFGFNSSELMNLQLTLGKSKAELNHLESFLLCILQHLSEQYTETEVGKLFSYLQISTESQEQIRKILRKPQSQAANNTTTSVVSIQSELIVCINAIQGTNLRLFYTKLPPKSGILEKNFKSGGGFNDQSVYLGMTFDDVDINRDVPKQYRLIIHQRSLFRDEDEYVQNLIYKFTTHDACLESRLRAEIASKCTNDVDKFYSDRITQLLKWSISDMFGLDNLVSCPIGLRLNSFCRNCLSLTPIKQYETGYLSQVVLQQLMAHYLEILNLVVYETAELKLAEIRASKTLSELLLHDTIIEITELETRKGDWDSVVTARRLQWLKLVQTALEFKPVYEFLRQINFPELRAKVEIETDEFESNLIWLFNRMGIMTALNSEDPFTTSKPEAEALHKAITFNLKKFIWKKPSLNSKLVEIQAQDLSLRNAVSELLSIYPMNSRSGPAEIRFIVSGTLFLDVDLPQGLCHGRNIVLVCDTLVFKRNMILNASGLDGEQVSDPLSEPIRSAQMLGRHGSPGVPGNPGEHGGNVFIKHKELQNPNNNKLQIACSGGRGSNGGNGEDGVCGKPGKSGVDGKSTQPEQSPGYDFEEGTEGARGQDGGKGGAAGPGGLGGQKGKIIIEGLFPIGIIETVAENGKGGDPGEPGKGADGGTGGHDGADSWHFWEVPRVCRDIKRALGINKGNWSTLKGNIELNRVFSKHTNKLFGYEYKMLKTEVQIKATRHDTGNKPTEVNRALQQTSQVCEIRRQIPIARDEIVTAWTQLRHNGFEGNHLNKGNAITSGSYDSDSQFDSVSIGNKVGAPVLIKMGQGQTSRHSFHGRETEEGCLIKLCHKTKKNISKLTSKCLKPLTSKYNRIVSPPQIPKTPEYPHFLKSITPNIKTKSNVLEKIIQDNFKDLENAEDRLIIIKKLSSGLLKLNNARIFEEFYTKSFESHIRISTYQSLASDMVYPQLPQRPFKSFYITSGLFEKDVDILIKSREPGYGEQLHILWEQLSCGIESTAAFIGHLRKPKDYKTCSQDWKKLLDYKNQVSPEVFEYVEESVWDRYLFAKVCSRLKEEYYPHKINEVVDTLKQIHVDFKAFVNPEFNRQQFCEKFKTHITRQGTYTPTSLNIEVIASLLGIAIRSDQQPDFNISDFIITKALEPLELTRTPELCFAIPYLSLKVEKLQELKDRIQNSSFNSNDPNAIAILDRINYTYQRQFQAQFIRKLQKHFTTDERMLSRGLEDLIESKWTNYSYVQRRALYKMIQRKLQKDNITVQEVCKDTLLELLAGTGITEANQFINVQQALERINAKERVQDLLSTVHSIIMLMDLETWDTSTEKSIEGFETQLTNFSNLMTTSVDKLETILQFENHTTMESNDILRLQKYMAETYTNTLAGLLLKSKEHVYQQLRKRYNFPNWLSNPTFQKEIIRITEVQSELELRESVLELIYYGNTASIEFEASISRVKTFSETKTSRTLTETQKIVSTAKYLTTLIHSGIYDEEISLRDQINCFWSESGSSRLKGVASYYERRYNLERHPRGIDETLKVAHTLILVVKEILLMEMPLESGFVHLLNLVVENLNRNLIISWVTEFSSVQELLTHDGEALDESTNIKRIARTKIAKLLKLYDEIDNELVATSDSKDIQIQGLEDLRKILQLTMQGTAVEKIRILKKLRQRRIEEELSKAEEIFSNLSTYIGLVINERLSIWKNWSKLNSTIIEQVREFATNRSFLNLDDMSRNLYSRSFDFVVKNFKSTDGFLTDPMSLNFELTTFYFEQESKRPSLNLKDLTIMKNQMLNLLQSKIIPEQKASIIQIYRKAAFKVFLARYINPARIKEVYLTWTLNHSEPSENNYNHYLDSIISSITTPNLMALNQESFKAITRLDQISCMLDDTSQTDFSILVSTFENLTQAKSFIPTAITQNLSQSPSHFNFEDIIGNSFLKLAYKYIFPVFELLKTTNRFGLETRDEDNLKSFIKNPFTTQPQFPPGAESEELNSVISAVKRGMEAISNFLSTGNEIRLKSLNPKKISALKYILERVYLEPLEYEDVTIILQVLWKDPCLHMSEFEHIFGHLLTSEWTQKMLEDLHNSYMFYDPRSSSLSSVFHVEFLQFLATVRTLNKPWFTKHLTIQLITNLLTQLHLFDRKLMFPHRQFQNILVLITKLLNQTSTVEDFDYLEELIKKFQKCHIGLWTAVIKNRLLMNEWKIDTYLAACVLRLESKYTEKILNQFLQVFKSAVAIKGNEEALKEILQSFSTGDLVLSETKCDKISNYAQSSQVYVQKSDKILCTIKNFLTSPTTTTPGASGLELEEVIQILKADTKNTSIMYMLQISELEDELDEDVFKLVDRYQKLLYEIDLVKDWQNDDIQDWLQNPTSDDNPTQYVEAHLEKTLAIINRGAEISLNKPLRLTQLLAALIFLEAVIFRRQSRLGEIPTGEGKSLITAVVAILTVLWGEDVDIVTSSGVLSSATLEQVQKLYDVFQIPVADLVGCDEHERKQQYKRCKVIYSDLSSLQQDFLLSKYQSIDITCGRKPGLVIVDEVDSMLLDKAENIFYLSHCIPDLAVLRTVYIQIWLGVQVQMADPEISEDEILSKVQLDIKGKVNSNSITVPTSLNNFLSSELSNWIRNAIESLKLRKDDTYVLANQDGRRRKVMVMDKSTGSEEPEMIWAKAMHQFLQLNHGEKLSLTSLKADFISNLSYFSNFKGKIIGMTGTLGSSEEREILKIAYSLEFFAMPRYQSRNCKMIQPIITFNSKDHIDKIIEQVVSIIDSSRSILVICENVEFVQLLLSLLNQKYFRPQPVPQILEEGDFVHDAREVGIPEEDDDDDSVEIVAYTSSFETHSLQEIFKSLKIRYIILSSNIAGRGTDIILSDTLKANGGLHTALTYMPPSSRLDDQGFGRSARSGDHGTIQYIILDKIGSEESPRSIEEIKTERDINNSKDLNTFRIQGLQKLRVEEDLLKRFLELRQGLSAKLQLEDKKEEFLLMQMDYLKNRWALWLECNGERINDQSNPDTLQAINQSFDQFKTEVTNLLFPTRDHTSTETFRLAQGPFELVQLGQYYQKTKDYKSAFACFQQVIEEDPLHAEMAYYHKGTLVLESMKDSRDTRRRAIKSYKKARALFRMRIADCLNSEKTIELCYNLTKKRGRGGPGRRIQLQLRNEADLWKQLLFSVNDLVGSPFTVETLTNIAGNRVIQRIIPAQPQPQIQADPVEGLDEEIDVPEDVVLDEYVGPICQRDAEEILNVLVKGLNPYLTNSETELLLRPIRLSKRVFITSDDELRIANPINISISEEPDWPICVSYLKQEFVKKIRNLSLSPTLEKHMTLESFNLDRLILTKNILWDKMKGRIFGSDVEETVQLICIPTGDQMTRDSFDELVARLSPEVRKALPSILTLLVKNTGRCLSTRTNLASIGLSQSGIGNLVVNLTEMGYLKMTRTRKAVQLKPQIVWNKNQEEYEGIPEYLEPFREIITDWLNKEDHLMEQLAVGETVEVSKSKLEEFLLGSRLFKKPRFNIPLQNPSDLISKIDTFIRHDLSLNEIGSKYFKTHATFQKELVKSITQSCGILITTRAVENKLIPLEELEFIGNEFAEELASFRIFGVTEIVEYRKWTRWYTNEIFVGTICSDVPTFLPFILMALFPATCTFVPAAILALSLSFLSNEFQMFTNQGYWNDEPDYKNQRRMECGQTVAKGWALNSFHKLVSFGNFHAKNNPGGSLKSIGQLLCSFSAKAVGTLWLISSACDVFERMDGLNLYVSDFVQMRIISKYKTNLINSEEMKDLWKLIQRLDNPTEEHIMGYYHKAKTDLVAQDDTRKLAEAAREAMALGLDNLGEIWSGSVGKYLNRARKHISGNFTFLQTVQHDLNENMKRGKMNLIISQLNVVGIGILRRMKVLITEGVAGHLDQGREFNSRTTRELKLLKKSVQSKVLEDLTTPMYELLRTDASSSRVQGLIQNIQRTTEAVVAEAIRNPDVEK